MLFIHPMWDSESQRIGKQKCTRFGYALHSLAELIGLAGLLILLILAVFFVGKWFAGTFRPSLWWVVAMPFALGVLSEALFQFSWSLALRKDFHYDSRRREASWREDGERRTYKYAA